MSKTRTFVAIEAVDQVRLGALTAIDRLRSATDNVKWVSPDNLHWTLQFLGDLNDQEIADVCTRVVRVAQRHESFTLVASGIGAFPSPGRPRTLWLGAGEGAPKVCDLQSGIENCLSDLGFRGERRKFVPHLTLGRIGRGGRGEPLLAERLSRLDNYDGGAMAVDEVAVYASQLERNGPTYHQLARASLA